MNRPTLKCERGNTIVEFAISLPLLTALLAGVFEFGYAFFVYNSLRNTVHSGARFGSAADYDSGGGVNFETQVKNVTTYGTPAPGLDARPLVPGLTPDMVNVVAHDVDAVGIPRAVTVFISGYEVPSIWESLRFNGKPSATFPYMGQFIDD